MIVWFSGVILIGGALSVIAVATLLGVPAPPMKGNLPLPFVPILFIIMLAFGVGLVRFGRWLARNEKRILVDFVSEVLDAKAWQEREPE